MGQDAGSGCFGLNCRHVAGSADAVREAEMALWHQAWKHATYDIIDVIDIIDEIDAIDIIDIIDTIDIINIIDVIDIIDVIELKYVHDFVSETWFQ